MKINKSLTLVANGIQAANMIHNLGNSKFNEKNMAVIRSNASMLMEAFRVFTEHAPEYHKAVLSQTIEVSQRYLEAYRGLKQHCRNNSGKSFRKEDFITTLKIVQPVLGAKRTSMVEKIIKMYELFNAGI